MCTGNYVQINKIMNFGLKWQHLGTDYLSCFTTAGMICTAAKLIKLDMLHSILEHVISSRYLNIFTLQMHGNAPLSTGCWSFSSWFHLDDRKKKNTCNINTTKVDMQWVLHATRTPFQHEFWIRAFAKRSFFMCVFIRNLWEIQRLSAELRDQDRNISQTTTAARLSKGRRAPHTYKRWNVHHISGPYSFSAACVFQLWSTIFPISSLALINMTLPHGSGYF